MITLREIFTISEPDLLSSLVQELYAAGYDDVYPHQAKGFIYAPGTIPVMLVAHVDCVFGHAEIVYFDPVHGVFWSPDGLGADDRAGVWGILYLIDRGYRPHVLFTDGEESGCWGARAAADAIGPTVAVSDVRVLVELDRRGQMESVFYDCGNQDVREWTAAVGFDERFGTFTDISILGPQWDVAAVNLSVGYHQEHSRGEYLVKSQLMETLDAVEKLLQCPPTRRCHHDTEMPRWAEYTYRHHGKGPGRGYRSEWWGYLDDAVDIVDTVDGASNVVDDDATAILPVPTLPSVALAARAMRDDGSPIAICTLCESPIWFPEHVRRFDGYDLCIECFDDLLG